MPHRRRTDPRSLLLAVSLLVIPGVMFAQDTQQKSSESGAAPSQEPIYSPGKDGVTIPRAINQTSPEYSEKARRNKVQGTVGLTMVITPTGDTTDIRVTKALGSGLDEKAIEAVRHWKFEPATKDGKPVAVKVAADVSFHLLMGN